MRFRFFDDEHIARTRQMAQIQDHGASSETIEDDRIKGIFSFQPAGLQPTAG